MACLRIPLALAGLCLVADLVFLYPYLKQRQSARWVQDQGGWVRTELTPRVDEFLRRFPPRVQAMFAPPKDDYDWWNPFHEVTWVDVDGIEMTDEDLLRLNDFPRLEVARLNNANITGECFKDIRPLEKVGTVTLQGSSVTDATLAHLPDAFPEASTVLLCRTDITDASVEHLEKMWELWSLSVDRTKMSREGVERIYAFPSVSHVTGVDGQAWIKLPNGVKMMRLEPQPR